MKAKLVFCAFLLFLNPSLKAGELLDRAGSYLAGGRSALSGMGQSLGGACRSARMATTCVAVSCTQFHDDQARLHVLQAASFATAIGGAVVGLASTDACAQAVSLPLAGGGALLTFLARQGGCSDGEANRLLTGLGLAASVAGLVTALTVRCKQDPSPPPSATPEPAVAEGDGSHPTIGVTVGIIRRPGT